MHPACNNHQKTWFLTESYLSERTVGWERLPAQTLNQKLHVTIQYVWLRVEACAKVLDLVQTGSSAMRLPLCNRQDLK